MTKKVGTVLILVSSIVLLLLAGFHILFVPLKTNRGNYLNFVYIGLLALLIIGYAIYSGQKKRRGEMGKKKLSGCLMVILITILIGVVLHIIMAIAVNVQTAKMQNTLKVGGLISQFKPATSPRVFVYFKKHNSLDGCLLLMPINDKSCTVKIYKKNADKRYFTDTKEIPNFEFGDFIKKNFALIKDCDEMSVRATYYYHTSAFSVLYSPDGVVTAINRREFSSS